MTKHICARCKKPSTFKYCNTCKKEVHRGLERVTKANRVKQGLCTYCGKRKAKKSKLRCKICIDKLGAILRKKRKLLKKNKVCINCFHRPVETGKTRCRICLDKSNTYKAKLKVIRVNNKICIRCNKPLNKTDIKSGKIRCKECTISSNKYLKRLRETRKRKKLCEYCKAPVESGVLCNSCKLRHNLKEKNRRKLLISKNLCARCGSNDLYTNHLCYSCSLKIKQLNNAKKCPESVINKHGYIPLEYWSYLSRRRYLRKLNNKCVTCNKDLNCNEKTYCNNCKHKERISRKTKEQKYKKAGLCMDCGNPVEPGRLRHIHGTCSSYKNIPKDIFQ